MKTEKERNAEGLELVRCAQANLENLGLLMPIVKSNPMYKIVEIQLKQAEEALQKEFVPKVPEVCAP
jgi:hypothetical protein